MVESNDYEGRIKNLELIISQRQDKINEHDKELAELRVQLAVMSTKQEEILNKLEKFTNFWTWVVRIVGGAFLISVYTWLTGGGLNN